ncbi:uncharacterized protein LOC113494905 isoform X2 [Trichoplusia ni]|nr:uncharacterized protein LOC113494905 isoform X2 [Trichoplusia ni]
MVYLIKSRESTDVYDSWLCGGALVTTTQILTSAACIIEIDNIYAIAGYRKYVNGRDIDRDNCTRLKKQRVVKIRVPREHIANYKGYTNSTQWMTLDIGVATVEKPYDFDDVSFKIYCSYIPTTIPINYNTHVDEKVGTNVVALGWGRDRGSITRDLVDRNSDTLREASIKIKEKEYCIQKFRGNALSGIIEKYMICAHGKGLLDGEGLIIEDSDKKSQKNCDELRSLTDRYDECLEDSVNPSFRSIKEVLNGTVGDLQKKNATHLNTPKPEVVVSRRQGICQNDHGGPLIAWVGSTELLIGVAVNSLYDVNFDCVGPYLFTSTSVAGQIVRCLLASEDLTRRNCPEAEIDGYNIFEEYVHSPQNGLIARTNVAPFPPSNENDSFSSIEVITL